MKKIILILPFIALILCSCSKEQKMDNNATDQVLKNNSQENNQGDKQKNIKQWAGRYEFDESAKGVNDLASQSWSYIVKVTPKTDSSLTADISIDGFQTMTRISADVSASEKTADFIFSEYGPDNKFGTFKKGEKLFSMELSGNNLITNWGKLQPNVISNQKNGLIMFKKMKATT